MSSLNCLSFYWIIFVMSNGAAAAVSNYPKNEYTVNDDFKVLIILSSVKSNWTNYDTFHCSASMFNTLLLSTYDEACCNC